MQIKFYLKNNGRKDLRPLYVQITHKYERTIHYFNEIKLNPLQWDMKKEEVKKTYEGYSDFNESLREKKNKVNQLINRYSIDNDGKFPDKETIKNLLLKEFRNIDASSQAEKNKTFSGYVDYFINQSINGIRKNSEGNSISPNTIKCYVTLKNILNAFEIHYKKKIHFETIDLDFYSDFQDYLQNTKSLKKNTISKHIRTLKTILREALDNDLHKNYKFTSRRFSAPNELTTAIYLNESELMMLYKLDLTDKEGLERVRDLFLISCYTGLRFSDLYQVSKNNIRADHENPDDLYLHIKQTKTQKPVIIPLHEIVLEILEKYNFQLPKPISSQKTNSHLKEIGKMIPSFSNMESIEFTKGGMKVIQNVIKHQLITTHTGRRSFASNSYLKGHKIPDIMAVTGHNTESSFFRYIRLTPMEKARSFKLHENQLNSKLRIEKNG